MKYAIEMKYALLVCLTLYPSVRPDPMSPFLTLGFVPDAVGVLRRRRPRLHHRRPREGPHRKADRLRVQGDVQVCALKLCSEICRYIHQSKVCRFMNQSKVCTVEVCASKVFRVMCIEIMCRYACQNCLYTKIIVF